MSAPALPWDSSSKMGTERTPGGSWPGFSPGHNCCWTTMEWGQPCVRKQKMPSAPKWESCLCALHEQSVPQFPHLSSALVGSNQATPIERLSWGLNLCLWRLVLLLWPPTSRYWMGILCLVACDWARGWISAACCPFFFRMPPRAVSTVQPCFFRSSEPFISSSDFRFLNLSNLSRVSG